MIAAQAPVAPSRRRSSAAWCALVGIASGAFFAVGVGSEPRFLDESAYLSQTDFADRFFEGRWHDPEWLSYAAIDLPPLPKYLFGGALILAGLPRYGPSAALAWYRDPGRTIVGDRATLLLARASVVPLAAIGCMATFAIGRRVGGLTVGLAAAALLAIDPLYAAHSRRAMSDVPCEALILLTAAVNLRAWTLGLDPSVPASRVIAWSVVAGVAGGLAVLAKLSGGLGLMVVGAQAIVGLGVVSTPIRRRLFLVGAAVASGVVGYATFVASNPFLWSHPTRGIPPGMADIASESIVGRTREVVRFRASVYEDTRSRFPKDALTSTAERVVVVAAQGFGRFGPLGPRTLNSSLRVDPTRDRGALVWLPLATLGVGLLARDGIRAARAGRAPAGWAVLAQVAVTVTTVTAFLPLAWDRYVLSIQPVAAVAGAYASASCARWALARSRWPGRAA